MRSAPTGKLTWLHLSDLHFGHGADARTRFEQQTVTLAILDDVKRMRVVLGSPDLVLLTGDIAFSAAPIEYDMARGWLTKLLTAAGVGAERLHLVPGNHDVNRKLAVAGPAKLMHQGIRRNPADVDELVASVEAMKGIWPKLEAYQAFSREYGCPELTPATPAWVKTIDTAVGAVCLIGLNTTFASFDNSDGPTTLMLGLGQLQRALEQAPSNALLFVLQHHPPKWLRDGDDLRAFLQQRPHILFCGHVHEQQGFLRLPLTQPGTFEMIAGAGHGDEAGEHAYAWGTLGRDGVEYFPRAWDAKSKRFRAQQIDPPKEHKQYDADVGEYVVLPRDRMPNLLREWLIESPSRAAMASVDSDVVAFRAPEESARPTVAPFDPAKPHFSVPHAAKGKGVIGRDAALAKVREKLAAGQPTSIGQTAAFVGLGGLGKTQLAVEYAHDFCQEYSGGVYWFNADEDLDGQLTRLAVEAQWVSPLSDAKTKLDVATYRIRSRSDCLIIFDNVEDMSRIDALRPLPPAKPHLLLTSRKVHPGFAPVDLERLDEAFSLVMLRSESQRPIDNVEEIAAAQRVLAPLDGLPLAIELAGAYLRRYPGVTLDTYGKQLEEKGIEARGLREDRYTQSFTRHEAGLRATLQISQSIFDATPRLRDVVDLLAWSASAAMGTELMRAALGVEDLELEEALSEGATLRIFRKDAATAGSGPRYQMHRLVREARRLEVPFEQNDAIWRNVARRIGDWFQQHRQDFTHLPLFEAELDHLQAWQEHAERLGETREAVRLLWLHAYPTHHRGRYAETVSLVQRALDEFTRRNVNDAELEGHLRNDLGSSLLHAGHYDMGLLMLQKAVDIRIHALGEQHPDTAFALCNLGSAYSHQKNNAKALETTERALTMQRRLPATRWEDLARSLHNAGTNLVDLGNPRRGLHLLQEAYRIQVDCQGEQDPASARYLAAIGFTLRTLRQVDDAVQKLNAAILIVNRVLGTRHPEVADVLDKLANAEAARGNVNDATVRHEEALRLRIETLGPDHPKTMQSRANIARVLMDRKLPQRAFTVVNEGLTAVPNHPELKRLRSELLGKKPAKLKKPK